MLFFAIEVNLVMWLAVLGILVSKPPDVGAAKVTALIGCALAAIVQHWAYYTIRKKV